MVGGIYKHNFRADKRALKFKEKSISYAQLDCLVASYAEALAEQGISRGDRVILSCLNSPEFVYSYFGTVRSGAVIVPISLLLTMEEIAYIVKDSQARFMIVHPLVLQKAKAEKSALEKALGLKVIVLDDSFTAAAEKRAESIPVGSDGMTRSVACDEDEAATFLYTSGTTGKQKAAMLSHRNLETNADQCQRALQSGEDDIYMCVLPMFHVFAFTACVLLPLYSGASIVIMESFQPKEVVETLLREKINTFMGVPAMYGALLGAGKQGVKFPDLHLAISGGAALPVEVYRQAREILNMPVIEGYGLTEASPAVCFNPRYGVQKPGSIGVHLPDVEIMIGDEQDQRVKAGEIGELMVRGGNVMKGYWNNPEDTAAALRSGWLHTGDMAVMDEEGYVFIVDRKKDMIIVGGLNVYSREVEEAIYQHPAVQEAAVVGIPDKKRGEAVKACIVLKPDTVCTDDDLMRFLRGKLASYKLPRKVKFYNALPKNSSGKIMKRELR